MVMAMVGYGGRQSKLKVMKLLVAAAAARLFVGMDATELAHYVEIL